MSERRPAGRQPDGARRIARRSRPRASILLVDDDLDVVFLTAAALEGDYDVASCPSLAEAHRAIRGQAFDLVLLDLNLGGESGRELIADSHGLRGTPVIVVSATTSARARAECLDMGASDFLVKPFDLDELGSRVRRVLHDKRDRDLLARRAAALEADSLSDSLTGLPNRRRFEKELQRLVGLAGRHGSHFAVLMVDIDHFKRVNDSRGHAAGDFVLSQVAAGLQAALRSTDLVGRLGGEEFGILLPHTDQSGASRLAEHIRQDVESLPLEREGKTIRVTISIGVASSRSSSAPLEAADEALYAAKRAGRNRVAVSPARDEESSTSD
ncbi:MAG: GGDEF domain-containing response regulator [Chloroflexota bacterium]